MLKDMETFVKIFRKISLLALVASMPLFQGCDFFRRVAGRPDSEELAAIRSEVLCQQAAERDSVAAVRAREDSLKAARAREEDSLRTLKAVRSLSGNILSVSSLGGFADGEALNRYYIVLGSYKFTSNANTLAQKADNAGFRTVLVKMKNGLTVVAVDPSDRISDVLASLRKVRPQDFCPEDVWVLVNE